MTEPTNIRLNDFSKGLQTVDKLDYPVDAVRAGSNIDISKHIRTRGGISTVDSVGLPANSEIMALQQVKFPTNEKTYLVAQVYCPSVMLGGYWSLSGSSPNYSRWEPETTVRISMEKAYPGDFLLFNSSNLFANTPSHHLKISGLSYYLDDLNVMDMSFPEGDKPIDVTGRRGPSIMQAYPPPDGSVVAVGGDWLVYHPLDIVRDAYSGFYFSNGPHTEDAVDTLYTAEVRILTLTYTKITIDEAVDESFTGDVTSTNYTYRSIAANYLDFNIELFMTQTEDLFYIHGLAVTMGDNGFTRPWPAAIQEEITVKLYITQSHVYVVAPINEEDAEDYQDESGDPYVPGTPVVYYSRYPTQETWHVYALPDTLPDTGA